MTYLDRVIEEQARHWGVTVAEFEAMSDCHAEAQERADAEAWEAYEAGQRRAQQYNDRHADRGRNINTGV